MTQQATLEAPPSGPPPLTDDSVAAVVARMLKARGVTRLFALCGGHIMPFMMRADLEGIEVVDVRDERCAAHMAHAHAELTGEIGVALVTAGPGVTNASTGIANAFVSRVPLLIISGVAPRLQENRGCLQDMSHTEFLQGITRYARTIREPALVPQELDEALTRALGDGSEPGPVFVDFPFDIIRAEVPRPLQMEEHFRMKRPASRLPDPIGIDQAVELLWNAKRPLVITGRGARGAGPEIIRLLDRLGAAYLDTNESRGLVPEAHPSVVAGARGAAMQDPDVIVTIGRRLDFQLAFGSPAIFGAAQFVRIADLPSELRDNRRGAVELLSSPANALEAILASAGDRPPAADREWLAGLRRRHEQKSAALRAALASAEPGSDGRMHPNRMLHEIQSKLSSESVLIVDGGDILSFARVALSAGTYLDPGSFGCLGVGVPFGVAAALARPESDVVVVTGDGSFGFNAMEIDTAVRHGARVLIVVVNNGAWQIEVQDQQQNYHRVVGTRLQFSDHAAMARAFGMYGERVERAEDLPGALDRALAQRPALLDVVVTPEAISSDSKQGLAWGPGLQALMSWEIAERRWRAGG